jgi:GT2 family glycosyltransferase
MTERRALSSVAITIPTFNQADYLPIAVRSAFAQNYAGPLEVWVSDDASTDNTSDVITRLTTQFSELRVIEQPQNLGIARNATAALRAPTTDFVIRLDSDDLLEPDYVTRLTELMLAHPDAAYGHSAVNEIDESGQVRRVRRLARRTGFQAGDAALRASLSGYRTTANIVILRKTAVESVGYYDGRPDYLEDYDLSVRLADADYGNVYSEDVLASYRVWSDRGGVRLSRTAMQLEGYRRLFEESLEPGWERRGWNPKEVARRRDRLAAHHAPSCFAPHYTPAERDQLVALLLRLGNGRRTRFTVACCRRGLGPALAHLDGVPQRVKNVIKAVIARARSGG